VFSEANKRKRGSMTGEADKATEEKK
jgi:hypothetical protein